MRFCRSGGVPTPGTRSMPDARSEMLDAAATWLVRVREPGFAEWAAFTSWLEADAAHNDAYEAALDAHDAADGLRDETVVPSAREAALPREARALRSRALWAGLAAAGVIATLAVPALLPRHDRFAVATAPGEQRSFRLADGTMIAMNGGTRLVLDRAAARKVRIETGEASFTVVHDAANPFVVTAGDIRIEDVGTIFNVVRSRDATDVAVAAGSVVYDPDGAGMKLNVGQTLHDPDRGMTEIGDDVPAAIGAWRQGRLVYRRALVEVVARDLARMIGEPVAVVPEIGSRRFSGTIVVRGVERRLVFTRLAAMLDVTVTHDAGGWRLASAVGAAR